MYPVLLALIVVALIGCLLLRVFYLNAYVIGKPGDGHKEGACSSVVTERGKAGWSQYTLKNSRAEV